MYFRKPSLKEKTLLEKERRGGKNEPAAQHTIILQDIVFASLKDTNAIQTGHRNGCKCVCGKAAEIIHTVTCALNVYGNLKNTD